MKNEGKIPKRKFPGNFVAWSYPDFSSQAHLANSIPEFQGYYIHCEKIRRADKRRSALNNETEKKGLGIE